MRRPKAAANRRSPLILSAVALTATAFTGVGLTGCSASDDAAAGNPAQSSESARSPTDTLQTEITAQIESLEKDFDAKVGMSAVDTTDGSSVEHRADERFGFASSLKVLAVAELLDRTTPEDLEKTITWSRADVDSAGWTPVTGKHVDDGLPLPEIAEAALRVSDNAAMNIVLDEIGGTEGLDAALEESGDKTTEVVDEEPGLNIVDPGSADNTTTPAAFTADLEGLLKTERLSTDDRDRLLKWMTGNETGDPLIRAGAPEGWVVKDKSGHSDGIQNDIAFVFPPGKDPIVLSILTESDDPKTDKGPALVEAVAEVVLRHLSR